MNPLDKVLATPEGKAHLMKIYETLTYIKANYDVSKMPWRPYSQNNEAPKNS